MKKKIRKTKIIAYAITLIGMIGFLGGFFINFKIIDYKGELPLSEVKNILVDDIGNIYVGLGFYGRIQVYNSYGNYLRSWQIPTGGGNFVMIFTKKQEMLVATARGNHLITYDLYGKMLHSEKYIKSEVYEKIESESDDFKDSEGYQYVEVGGMLSTKIVKVKVTPPQQAYIVISQGILMQIFKGTFPTFLFAMLGVIILFFADIGKDTNKEDIPYYQVKVSKNRK